MHLRRVLWSKWRSQTYSTSMLDSTAWFVAHDSDDYAKIYTNSDMDRYMAATAIALGQPEGLGELHQSVIERVLARLSMNFGYCIGPGQAETRLQVAAVDMIPTLFRWLTTNGNHSPDGQAFMFWDSVIPRRKVGPEVRDACLALSPSNSSWTTTLSGRALRTG